MMHRPGAWAVLSLRFARPSLTKLHRAGTVSSMRDGRANPFAEWQTDECPECGADIPSDDDQAEARRKHFETCSEYRDVVFPQ